METDKKTVNIVDVVFGVLSDTGRKQLCACHRSDVAIAAHRAGDDNLMLRVLSDDEYYFGRVCQIMR